MTKAGGAEFAFRVIAGGGFRRPVPADLAQESGLVGRLFGRLEKDAGLVDHFGFRLGLIGAGDEPIANAPHQQQHGDETADDAGTVATETS